MQLTVSKNLFSAYTGLTASGYELADKRNESLQRLIAEIHDLNISKTVINYFSEARTNEFEINPYWPRGSVISSASFFITDDGFASDDFIAALREWNNIDITDELLEWIVKLPAMIRTVQSAPDFERLWNEYIEILNSRMDSFLNAQKKIEDALEIFHGASGINTGLVFAPNLLQAPQLADYINGSDNLTVIAVAPDMSSMLHEYLHPFVAEHRNIILSGHCCDGFFDAIKMKESGYLINDSDEAKGHVTEECIVRGITAYLMNAVAGSDYGMAEQNYRDGFYLAEEVYRRACANPVTAGSLRDFIAGLMCFA